MSSRVKDRGGGGGKVMALKPQKALMEGTPKDKAASRRTPSAGKENPRRTPAAAKENPKTLSNSKVVPHGMRQRLLPADVPQIDKAAAAAGPPPSIRWSTSSMPRGKASNPSDFARMLADLRAGDGGRNRLSRASVAVSSGSEGVKNRDLKMAESSERRSVGTGRNSEKSQQLKKVAASRSTANGKDYRTSNGVSVSENSKPNGVLGMHPISCSSRFSSANSGTNRVKHLDGSVGERDSSVIDSVDSGQNKYSGTEKEGVKVLEEVGKRDNYDTVFVEISKGNSSLVPDSKCVHGKASESAVAFENLKERNQAEFNSKVTSEVSSNRDVILLNHKEDSLVLCLKAACDTTVEETVVSDSSTKYNKDSHSEAEGIVEALDGIAVFEKPAVPKSEGGKGVPVINRYSSKLHEKLAFLEGKVQRIASDIKRTKEMLEQNNPDASKLILSDIQNKISGIEKAVSNVMGGDVEFSSSAPVKDRHQPMCIENSAHVEAGGELKNLVKELNHEELEARFFPHHKLLRSRASLASSGEQDKDSKPVILKHTCDPVRDKSLSPIDENPIALEFLASLNADKSNVNTHSRAALFDSAAIQQMGSDNTASSGAQYVSKNLVGGGQNVGFILTSDEKIEEFEELENKPVMVLREATEESSMDQLFEIGCKSSTGGWFVSEGEAVLLAHSDSSCSYYDIANNEEKAEYHPPMGISSNLWGDCWLIRAPGVDGCSGRYVVAASAGNTLDSGFCSWDFYTKDVCAFRVEDGRSSSLSTASSSARTVLAPLPNTSLYRRSSLCTVPALGSQQWWYRPCGPLLVSASSRQSVVNAYDIRDGELVMTWELRNPMTAMEYSSPLQWRSRGKVVIAELEGVSLWDVNSLNPRPLLSVASGKKITALHVNNTDAELGGGVRQRISSSEVEGNDGVLCTQESIHVIDLRLPSGVGLKISKPGCDGHSIFSRGDSIYLGCSETRVGVKGAPRSLLQQFSLRKGKLTASYLLPNNNAHIHHSALTQVWGNSNLVMGICGMGLFIFDAVKNELVPSFTVELDDTMDVREIIGPDDMYYPSFDYLGSRVLVISRDRPAMWRYML